MDQNRDSLKTTNPIAGLPGAVFEKAWEVRWALKLAYVGLFIDIALMHSLGTTLLGFSGDMAIVWENVGRIFVGIMVFCLVVSVVIPVLAQVAAILGSFIPWHRLQGPRDYSLFPNYVTFSALREHSLREGNEFLYNYWKRRTMQREEWRQQRFQAGVLVFGLVLMAIANAGVSAHFQLPGLMAYITFWFGWKGYALLSIVTLYLLHWAWWSSDEIGQIYYPPLAEKLKKNQY
ncbi:hypothetical protein D3C76_1036960 [compost metagenome]|uniref:hypothetical protein n=1 Tax=Pseudomonas TaxID=286 RepID=UPI000648C0DA|nr:MULTISPECIES: hypothetical protein [Pseudomonas]ANI36439.1 hypothetical protein AA098_24125 [Pseudomonas sp. JY-Q]EKT4541560.1 hypothetical protein [Pseudomonas putida]MCE1059784.1 hypothetical protein [Pseudomonas alloputida]MCX2708958.1 hypothetical protein [Pseudomonas sp. DCB_BG]MDF3930073.1 hypothetical protein [Pseudomonas putida]